MTTPFRHRISCRPVGIFVFSVAGCPEAAVTNIFTAMQSAIKHGALGMTVAHWAGVGHITHQTMSWPGLLTAAGLAWNSNIQWVCLKNIE